MQIVIFFLIFGINVHCIPLSMEVNNGRNQLLLGAAVSLLEKSDPKKFNELWNTVKDLMNDNIKKYKDLKDEELKKKKELEIETAAFKNAEETFEYAEVQKVNAVYNAAIKLEERNNASKVKKKAEEMYLKSSKAFTEQSPDLENELATLSHIKDLLRPLGKKNILLVLNMQNDYCKDCPPTNPITLNRRSTKLLPTANIINKLMMMQGNTYMKPMFDLVVFTHKGLEAGTVPCWNGKKIPHCSSLVRGSEGAKVIKVLIDNAQKAGIESYHFTTENEDSFHSPDRAHNQTLEQILKNKGFDPDHANIVIVGAHIDGSILKTATHALFHGYPVFLINSATCGGSVVSHNWVTSVDVNRCDINNYHNSHICSIPAAQRRCCPTECAGYSYVDSNSCGPPVTCEDCTEEQHHEWLRRIFLGKKGSPALSIISAYMQSAGVKIFETITELHQSLVFS